PLVVLAHPHVSIAALCVFPLLALAAELLGEDIYGSSSVSLSAVPVLAAIAAGLAVPAVVAALVSGLASTSAGRSRRLEQWLFNPANLVLAATAAAGARLAVPLPAHIRTALPFLLPLMVVIALGYFLLDNGLVALVVARDERRRAADVFRHDLAWLAPHFGAYGLLGALLGAAWQSFGVWGLAVFLLPLALVRLAQQQYLGRTASHVSELRRLAEDLHVSKTEVEATNAALQVALRSVSEAHRQTATALAGAIDARDAITGGHIERVAALGVALCEVVDPALASDPQVAFGFLLHDVGKIGVPDAVLLKPGPLDSHEQDIMRKHPEIGERLVTSAGFAPVAREIVATHHERWDGAGYPQGLSGTQIPLCSRLFSVADALDAMVSDRPYRRGMPLARAFDELRGSTGSQFDPMAVEAVLSLDPERVAQLLRLHEPGRRKSQLRAVND
ncbi:MAG TPA: HD domain-containing phosphohydrolase, partial [Mycobacteriales bacterium]|nr:HD domain-containing phosphohydrolase [Mycobacteriales bacterium]